MSNPRPRLGRGLSALLPPPVYAAHRDDYFLCPLQDIQPDPHQPRQTFDEAALDELTASIREKGIIQPLVVRQRDRGGFVLIAGERRLRAATRLGLKDIPVVVKDVASEEAYELALIENIQRQDLNAIEEASAYARLLKQPGMTQQSLATRLGKPRPTIANAVRLLKLAPSLQAHLADGALHAGHARAILSLKTEEQRTQLAARIMEEKLTVRDAEQLAKTFKPKQTRTRGSAEAHPLADYLVGISNEIAKALATPVEVKISGKEGKLVITFRGIEHLRSLRDRLL